MKLSIITINLNNVDGLSRTLKSVINQTFIDYEYIIIDGGSNDGSVDLIRSVSDKVTYWVSEPDNGIYNAMNKGILKSNGDYLLFLNSGDWLFDNNVILNVFANFIDYDIVYGDVCIVSSSAAPQKHCLPIESDITLSFFINSTITHQAAFIRKELLKSCYYDEDCGIFGDWKFLIQKIILENCSLKKVDLTIVYYDNNGISNMSENIKQYQSQKYQMLLDMLPPRIFKDYELFMVVKNSKLLPYLPVLNRTSGLQKLIEKIVKLLIIIYKIRY